jgi:hypothetical protein
MKALPSFGRNDVIRAVALMSVAAFPLIADAQLGLGSKAIKISDDVSPLASSTTKAAIAGRDSCGDQHWPFFSEGCLRGSTEAIKPRLVSVNVESPANSAATGVSVRVVGAADTARGNAPLAKSKKLIKPRAATHMRERRNLNYAANSEAGHMSLAGW